MRKYLLSDLHLIGPPLRPTMYRQQQQSDQVLCSHLPAHQDIRAFHIHEAFMKQTMARHSQPLPTRQSRGCSGNSTPGWIQLFSTFTIPFLAQLSHSSLAITLNPASCPTLVISTTLAQLSPSSPAVST